MYIIGVPTGCVCANTACANRVCACANTASANKVCVCVCVCHHGMCQQGVCVCANRACANRVGVCANRVCANRVCVCANRVCASWAPTHCVPRPLDLLGCKPAPFTACHPASHWHHARHGCNEVSVGVAAELSRGSALHRPHTHGLMRVASSRVTLSTKKAKASLRSCTGVQPCLCDCSRVLLPRSP